MKYPDSAYVQESPRKRPRCCQQPEGQSDIVNFQKRSELYSTLNTSDLAQPFGLSAQRIQKLPTDSGWIALGTRKMQIIFLQQIHTTIWIFPINAHAKSSEHGNMLQITI